MECRVNQPREFIKPRSNRRDALQFLPSSPTSSSSLRVQYLDDPTRVSISPLFLPVCAARHTSFIGGGEVDRQSRITISSFLDARGDVSKRKGAQLERYKGCGSLDNFPILINGARPKEATNVGAATLPPWAELHWRELNLTNPHNTGPTALSPCFSFGLYDRQGESFRNLICQMRLEYSLFFSLWERHPKFDPELFVLRLWAPPVRKIGKGKGGAPLSAGWIIALSN